MSESEDANLQDKELDELNVHSRQRKRSIVIVRMAAS